MENYMKPNSFKSKEENKEPVEEKKRLEKVITGTVKTKKKSGLSKVFSGIVSEDAANIKGYIVNDVVIPSIKKGIMEIVSLILGERPRKTSSIPRVSYRSYYDEPRAREPIQTAPRYSYEGIVLDSRGEAEEVLSTLCEALEVYGFVSINDLYDTVGLTSQNYTDANYGWDDLSTARVDRTRDGFELRMPKPIPLRNIK